MTNIAPSTDHTPIQPIPDNQLPATVLETFSQCALLSVLGGITRYEPGVGHVFYAQKGRHTVLDGGITALRRMLRSGRKATVNSSL